MICCIHITPDQIQAFAAIVTLILAIVTYFQGRKIKTLTDLVSKIENQNVILEKRFNLEKIVALSKEIPLFKLDHKDQTDIDKARIYLINKGVEAKSIQTDQSNSDHYSVFYMNILA